MLKSFSNKAIATKARAMYGARVTAADCEELVKKRSVGEVAAYLRDNTHYREVLTQVDPSAIHRGQLENFLRSLSYIQYRRPSTSASRAFTATATSGTRSSRW